MKYEDLVKDNRFLVYIGTFKFSFARISGIISSFSKEVYVEGGDSMPYMFKANPTDLNTLKLERGVTKGYPGIFQPGIYTQYIQIIVLGKNNKPQCEYYIPNAVVTKMEVAQFDALSENVLIETFEVEYCKAYQISL